MRRVFGLLIAVVALISSAADGLAAFEIILDNPCAEIVGEWTTGTITLTRYGDDYYYCAQHPVGGRSATYLPFIPQAAADWSVYTWYPAGSNRPTQAQFIIHTSAGDDEVYVNQQINGQQWFYLGTYPMEAGAGNCVRITNYGSETDKVVMADAIRFFSPSASSAPDTTPPVISAISVTPEPGSAVVTWTTDEPATSQVEYGETTSYGSFRPKQPALVLNHSAIVSGLSFPATYHFRMISEDLSGNLGVSDDLTFTTSTEIPQTPSFRAAWAGPYGCRSADEVTTMIDVLHGANYNVVIPSVRGPGGAYYDSAYENRSISIIDPPPFDPLADIIAKGHAAGMEIHPFISVYRIAYSSLVNAPPVFYEHPEWLTKSNTGEMISGDRYTLDPGVPGVQDYLCKIVLDIVSKYDVDGFNLDYIRYEGNTWGYNEITRQRFCDEYGFWPPNSAAEPGWDTWCDYRRQQVTDLVKKCYLEVMAVKPHVKMTADTIARGSATDFAVSSAYSSVLQDWRGWMEEHILDASIPMNYKDESLESDAEAFRDWSQFTVDNRYGRHGYVGTGLYRNSITAGVTQIYSAIHTGADGISTFSYSTTNDEGRPASEFYDSVLTNLYTSPVPTPEMPWKTQPTTGIIFGTVTDAVGPNDPIYQDWVYKADVSISGPVTLNTQTDATGTYGFIDLPPGTYSLTVSKAGFPTRTIPGVQLGAGEVVRKDVALGTVTVTSPAGVVVNGWSLLSLPQEPAHPDPASVFSGINIDAALYRWDNPTQGLHLYDMWNPEPFGNLDVKNGYWLQSFSAETISYEAYASTATSHDIPLTKVGWAIIGCPFTSDKQWPDTTVTYGTETVSILTAAHTNGWMSSIGYWWDASTQSLNDLGLREDWASSEILQPWHGYWVQTYVDALTLTLQ